MRTVPLLAYEPGVAARSDGGRGGRSDVGRVRRVVIQTLRKRRRRRLLVTTVTLDKPIAAAA